jgi:RNA polymerase sigma factor (sigma-70 family)
MHDEANTGGAFDVSVDDSAQKVSSELLRQLFKCEYRRLVDIARVVVKDRGMAEEIVNDVFVRCYSRLADVDNPAAYLTRSVMNASRSAIRPRRLSIVPLVERAVSESSASIAVSELDASGEMMGLTALLEQLPSRQRECVALRVFSEFEENEIAEVLGISRRSVRTHLQRAFAALGSAISSQEDHP